MALINVKNDEFYKEFCQAYYENPGKDELEDLINRHKEDDTKFDNDKISYYGDFDKKGEEYMINGMLLERCKQVLELVDLYHPILRIDTISISKGLKILTKEHEKHSLISEQLHTVIGFIEECISLNKLNIEINDECFIYMEDEFNESEYPYTTYEIEMSKHGYYTPNMSNPIIVRRPKFDLEVIKNQIQAKFKWLYTEDDILDAVHREASWRDVERDINIYKERKKGIFIKDLMKIYNLDKSTISVIAKKVEGKVNYIKGHLFEGEYSKYLRGIKFYDKVVWNGASGRPDIVCYKEDNNQVDIYSLKCLKITKKQYFISKKDLAPEYKIAYDLSFSYKTINLFLVVFNYLNNSVKTIPLDWKNPENVVIR